MVQDHSTAQNIICVAVINWCYVTDKSIQTYSVSSVDKSPVFFGNIIQIEITKSYCLLAMTMKNKLPSILFNHRLKLCLSRNVQYFTLLSCLC